MGLIVIFVFLGVFGVVVLMAAASGTGASKQDKQMLIMTRLGIRDRSRRSRRWPTCIVDVRKNELLSTIPWIDKLLRKLELDAADCAGCSTRPT